MNIPLQRLIDGIVATMRADVIPNVADPYARGQAVGVIDLLNNIAPRVEWAQAPLVRRIAEKRALLAEISRLVPHLQHPATPPTEGPRTADDLLTIKAGLDAAIGDAIALLWSRRSETEVGALVDRVKAHLHDEMTAEMRITRKPLFAEIASGGDGAKT